MDCKISCLRSHRSSPRSRRFQFLVQRKFVSSVSRDYFWENFFLFFQIFLTFSQTYFSEFFCFFPVFLNFLIFFLFSSIFGKKFSEKFAKIGKMFFQK